ncbi:MAG: hypothetical protein RR741_07190, partial [Erysipelotrichaceae bacterium]
MKRDTIKKLVLVGLLILGTGSISGCSSKQKGDPKQKEESFKFVSSKGEHKDLDTMSVEETKALVAGDQIHKLPDAKTLESMGLCYEVVYEVTQTLQGKKLKTETRSVIEPEDYDIDETYDDSVIINGENRHNLGTYQYVHIIPIEGVIIINGETTWYKDVCNIRGKSWILDIKFEENIEILKAMF